MNSIVLLIMLSLASQARSFPVEGVCLRETYGRGAGTPLVTQCNPGEVEIASLCYKNCEPGYEMITGNICRKVGCGGLSGAEDIGISCRKPDEYGRGAGHISQWECERNWGISCEHPCLFCLWYPNCKPGFHIGGLFCYPNYPSGYKDDGLFCEKPSYGNGVGQSRLGCPQGKVYDAGLCYNPCSGGYVAVGPLCWRTCQGAFSESCGIVCSTNVGQCAAITAKVSVYNIAGIVKPMVTDRFDLDVEGQKAIAEQPYCR